MNGCSLETCCEDTSTSTTITPQPRDCNDVCEDSTDPEFIGDICCSRHYCACEMGLGADRYCNEGEGFCSEDGRCSKGGCSLEACCANTPPPTTSTSTSITPQPEDCDEVCKYSTDLEFIGDSCCSHHYCACAMGLGADMTCDEGEGFSLCDKKCTAGCFYEADCLCGAGFLV